MTPPLVAVTGMRSSSVEGLRLGGVVASEKVLDAVRRAGGCPVVLAPSPTGGVPLSRFDAIVIPGGRDMDPATYGGDPAGVMGRVDAVQDRFEIDVARDCVEKAVPLLAICRGLQVLNTALGGTLVEDVPLNDVPHRVGYHVVTLEESLVRTAMGTAQVDVSSYHHQAIDRLGRGLRAVGHAADGCIEAVQHDVAPLLAVQWHPEDDAAERPPEQGLFDALVQMASSVNQEAVIR